MLRSRTCWIAITVFLLASVAVAALYPGAPKPARRPGQNIPAVKDIAEHLLAKHPLWVMRDASDGSYHLRAYLVAPGHVEPERWTAPALNYPHAEDIALLPFEEKYWQGIVYIQLYQSKNENKNKSGWYGPVLVKGPFLFYGDQKMLKQIDRNLESK